MYCKNCGNSIDPNAAVCVNCGTPVGQGNNFCGNCGTEVDPNAAVCMSCGYALKGGAAAASGAKSKLVAGLLGILLGAYGAHNFYLGYTKKAVIQLSITLGSIILTVITCGIAAIITPFIIIGISVWGLIEGIYILSGKINTDADGVPLKD